MGAHVQRRHRSKAESTQNRKPNLLGPAFGDCGAGEGIRTLDVNLGKVALYH